MQQNTQTWFIHQSSKLDVHEDTTKISRSLIFKSFTFQKRKKRRRKETAVLLLVVNWNLSFKPNCSKYRRSWISLGTCNNAAYNWINGGVWL